MSAAKDSIVGPNSRVVIDEFVFNPDGTATDVALNTLKGTFRFISGKSPHDAVKLAADMGTSGDVVLLSPACASFDMFENYEHRGREFKKAVQELIRNA